MALNAISREFGEQGHAASHAQDVSKEMTLISCLEIEGLHPLLREYKQHVHGGATGSVFPTDGGFWRNGRILCEHFYLMMDYPAHKWK